MSRFGLGFNQKGNFNGSTPVSTAAISMGAMRGKGSTTRKFNYCKTHSPAPWQCIDQFVNIQETNPPVPPVTSSWSTVPGQGFANQGGTFGNSGVVDNNGNIYVTSFTQLSIYKNDTQLWQPPIGINSQSGIPRAYLLSNNNIVYIGGNFTSLSGSVSLISNYFASYNVDQNKWTNLNVSNYITSPITAFTVKNNVIYIAVQGGTSLITYTISREVFGTIGSITPLLSSDIINNIAVDNNNNIYISGIFNDFNNVNRVLVIDNGTNFFRQVAGYFDNQIDTLAIDNNNNVYVGGGFNFYNDEINPKIPMNYISVWNGTTWSALPSSNGNLNAGVNSIVIDSKNNLYIGGAINTTTTTLHYIAKWSPSNPAFNPLQNGLNNAVTYLFTGNSNLYVLGLFTGYYNNLNPPSVTTCQFMTTWTNI